MTPTELVLQREARDRARSAPSRADADHVRAVIERELAPIRKALIELRQRHNELTTYVNSTAPDGGLAAVLGKYNAERADRLIDECKALINNEFKSRAPVIYRGVWNSAADYLVGDLVTFGGGGWICRADHRDQKPGSGGCWQLAIKSA